MLVYPADEYAKMSDYGDYPAQNIKSLQEIIANLGASLPNELPFLPTFNANQMFHSNAQVIQFKNGAGLRFLTQFAQAYYPINNNEMVYTFQGLTSDGKYYISAILPVIAPFLSSDGNPNSPLPPGGIPFNMDKPEQYFAAIAQQLEATTPADFTPTLTILDTLLQSLLVATP